MNFDETTFKWLLLMVTGQKCSEIDLRDAHQLSNLLNAFRFFFVLKNFDEISQIQTLFGEVGQLLLVFWYFLLQKALSFYQIGAETFLIMC